MGCNESRLPLSSIPGREITSDTLLLAELARSIPFRICFDLGTGSGEILKNTNPGDAFSVGIDLSIEALALFDRSFGQPVQCSVDMVSSTFRKGCADLVLANPPYNITGSCRKSPDPLRREAREGDSLLLHRFIFAGAHLLATKGCMLISGTHERIKEIELGFRSAGFKEITRIEKNGVLALKALLKSP